MSVKRLLQYGGTEHRDKTNSHGHTAIQFAKMKYANCADPRLREDYGKCVNALVAAGATCAYIPDPY